MNTNLNYDRACWEHKGAIRWLKMQDVAAGFVLPHSLSKNV